MKTKSKPNFEIRSVYAGIGVGKAINQVENAVVSAVPGLGTPERVLLKCAKFGVKGFVAIRQMQLLKKKKNRLLFAAGGVIAAATEDKPTAKKVAAAIFCTYCIIRCAEDLQKVQALRLRIVSIATGQEYLVIRGDKFDISGAKRGVRPSAYDKLRFKKEILIASVIALVKAIRDICKAIWHLLVHLADAATVSKRNTVPEMLIHSRSFWRQLSSDETFLANEIKNNKDMHNAVLKALGSGLTAKFLLGCLKIPLKIAEKLPDGADVKHSFKDMIQERARNFDANAEDVVIGLHVLTGGDKELLFDLKYYTYKIGSKGDPETTRYIKPPVILRA